MVVGGKVEQRQGLENKGRKIDRGIEGEKGMEEEWDSLKGRRDAFGKGSEERREGVSGIKRTGS